MHHYSGSHIACLFDSLQTTSLSKFNSVGLFVKCLPDKIFGLLHFIYIGASIIMQAFFFASIIIPCAYESRSVRLPHIWQHACYFTNSWIIHSSVCMWCASSVEIQTRGIFDLKRCAVWQAPWYYDSVIITIMKRRLMYWERKGRSLRWEGVSARSDSVCTFQRSVQEVSWRKPSSWISQFQGRGVRQVHAGIDLILI